MEQIKVYSSEYSREGHVLKSDWDKHPDKKSNASIIFYDEVMGDKITTVDLIRELY